MGSHSPYGALLLKAGRTMRPNAYRFSPGLQLPSLLAALGVGVGVGLHAGGSEVIKHFVLRLSLIRNGLTPWNYIKFLDYAADRILLRKVNGGYMFIHRMLFEWFAKQYIEPGTLPKKDPSSGEQQSA